MNEWLSHWAQSCVCSGLCLKDGLAQRDTTFLQLVTDFLKK